jgi:predicted transposase YbfD/YdcC
VESGGEYIWFAKGNQYQIEEDIRLWFESDGQPIPGMSFPPKDFETAQRTNKGHGRLETQTITVSSQLKDFLNWFYLEQVFKLDHHFVSLWGIESGLHYRRDVTLREHYTRMTKGKAGQVMACLNNLILGILLSKKKYPTIPDARRYYCAHPAEALNLFLRF